MATEGFLDPEGATLLSSKDKPARSVRAFQNALIELYQSKSIEDLSVEELLKASGYSRSTFYFYFSSLDDLLRQIETEVLQEIGPYFVLPSKAEELEEARSGELPQSCKEWFLQCKKHQRFLQASLGPHGNPSFTHKFRKLIRKGIYDLAMFDGLPDDRITALNVEMISGGILSMLMYCFQTESEQDFESMMLSHKHTRNFRIQTKRLQSKMKQTMKESPSQ